MRDENIMLKTLITTEVSDIHNKIKDHCQKCDSKDIQTQKLSESLQEKIREHTQAMNEITNLRCKVSELNTKLSAQSWSSFRGHSSPRTVLLGSSIVRDISESRLLNTDVTSISGGHINDISNALDKKPSDEKYDRAILVVGGNDCDPRDATNTSPSTIVDNYRRLVKQTKTKGLFTPKTRVFFGCGNSAADISKSHTFKWGPLADEVLEAACISPTEKRRPPTGPI